MAPHRDGVLTAFANVENNPRLFRIHYSPDGRGVGSGPIKYEGCSPVRGMIPFRGGVLTAFSNAENNPNLHRIHFSPDGENLGGGPIEYQGTSPVTAMSQYGANSSGDLFGDADAADLAAQIGAGVALFGVIQAGSRDAGPVIDRIRDKLFGPSGAPRHEGGGRPSGAPRGEGRGGGGGNPRTGAAQVPLR